jgi:arabinofuranosyltransferase
VKQGVRYIFDSLDRDPITLVIIVFGVLAGLRNPTPLSVGLSVGIVLHFIYILRIGGDFMSGRLFATLLFASVIIVARQTKIERPVCVILVLILAGIGASSKYMTLLSDSRYDDENISASGIANERGYYYQSSGLLSGNRQRFTEPPRWPDRASAGRRVDEVKSLGGGLGFAALNDGPFVHYVDTSSLADPLLARLPARPDPNWRIGHHHRSIPEHYISSLLESRNLLGSGGLGEYYDKIMTLTRSNLWSRERFLTIWRMNLGRYSHLIDEALIVRRRPDHLSQVKPDGTKWNDEGNVVLLDENYSLYIDFGAAQNNEGWIDVSYDNNDRYLVVFEKKGAPTGQLELAPAEIGPDGGLVRSVIRIPEHVQSGGFDSIAIKPISGDGSYSIGHFLVKDTP